MIQCIYFCIYTDTGWSVLFFFNDLVLDWFRNNYILAVYIANNSVGTCYLQYEYCKQYSNFIQSIYVYHETYPVLLVCDNYYAVNQNELLSLFLFASVSIPVSSQCNSVFLKVIELFQSRRGDPYMTVMTLMPSLSHGTIYSILVYVRLVQQKFRNVYMYI